MMRAVSRRSPALGLQVGALLTWNTLGAVVGTLLTGFVLMPLVGLRNAFGVLALVLTLAAMVFAWRCRWRHRRRRRGWLEPVCRRPVCFRQRRLAVCHQFRRFPRAGAGVQPSRDGLHESSILKSFFMRMGRMPRFQWKKTGIRNSDPDLCLRINGKPDASSHDDLSTQLLLAHLPMLARPGAKDVLFLALARAYPPERCLPTRSTGLPWPKIASR